MAGKKHAPKKVTGTPMGAEAVSDFLISVDHPLKPVLEAIRKSILTVHPEILEGIKWNAVSFQFQEFFATTGLQKDAFVRVVLHRGAKVRDDSSMVAISDPDGLLEWHADDRASLRFTSLADFERKTKAFQSILRQWLKFL
ncbi:hypothetical protein BH11PLA2_BH11PLA2_25260 [soil metagenome]